MGVQRRESWSSSDQGLVLCHEEEFRHNKQQMRKHKFYYSESTHFSEKCLQTLRGSLPQPSELQGFCFLQGGVSQGYPCCLLALACLSHLSLSLPQLSLQLGKETRRGLRDKGEIPEQHPGGDRELSCLIIRFFPFLNLIFYFLNFVKNYTRSPKPTQGQNHKYCCLPSAYFIPWEGFQGQ